MGRRIAIALFALVHTAEAHAQLADPRPARTVSAQVTDERRQPIAGVEVGRPITEGLIPVTNSDGYVSWDSRAPSAVFRKLGYESTFVRFGDATEFEVVMRRFSESLDLPPCAAATECVKVANWSSRFCFHLPKRIRARKQTNDIDYGNRVYLVRGGGPDAGIRHGAGSQWSYGPPFYLDVWESVEYTEYVYRGLFRDGPIDGAQTFTWIIDARGKVHDGTYWRNIGRFGESAGYRGATRQEADILDEVIDSVCLTSASPSSRRTREDSP